VICVFHCPVYSLSNYCFTCFVCILVVRCSVSLVLVTPPWLKVDVPFQSLLMYNFSLPAPVLSFNIVIYLFKKNWMIYPIECSSVCIFSILSILCHCPLSPHFL
jgi:hypothetical protein